MSLASPTHIPSQNLEALPPSSAAASGFSFMEKASSPHCCPNSGSWGHKLTDKAIYISDCCGEAGNWSSAQNRPRIPFQDLLSRPEQIHFLEETHQWTKKRASA